MNFAHHILVVDDETDIVELLSFYPEKETCKVESASNGKKAFEDILEGILK